MEVKLYENHKLFTVTNKGVKEIDSTLVKVEFNNGFPTYKLKEGNQEQLIVQSINSKRASSKLLQLIIEKRKLK